MRLKLCLLLISLCINGVVLEDLFKINLQKVFGKSQGSPAYSGKCDEPLLLSKYLKKNDTTGARNASLVRGIMKCVKSYSGFITVNETYSSNLWFWYFPASEVSPSKAPLLVYPSAQTGTYSTYDALWAFAPYTLQPYGGKLKRNKNSWARRHSLLIVDAPAGSGYSFTNDDRGYAVNASQVGFQLYSFMKQIRLIYTEMQSVKIFAVGNIFGATYAASIGIKVLEYGRNKSPFDLAGLILFNGFFDAVVKFNQSTYLRNVGLIDDKTADTVEKYEKAGARASLADNVTGAADQFGKAEQLLLEELDLPSPWSFAADYSTPPETFIGFLQNVKNRCSLHVGYVPLNILGKVYDKLRADLYTGSSGPWLEKLINNYPVLFSSGSLFPFSQYYPLSDYYDSLNFKSAPQFRNATRKFFSYNGIVVGYYKEAKNVTSLVFRNCGNVIQAEHTDQIEAMIYDFTRNGKLT